MRLPLSTILSAYQPTDMLDYAHGPTPAEAWSVVFRSIEAAHVSFAPDYWERFKRSVAKRQRTPVTITANGKVVNGHHRVWALHLAGKESVRVEMEAT